MSRDAERYSHGSGVKAFRFRVTQHQNVQRTTGAGFLYHAYYDVTWLVAAISLDGQFAIAAPAGANDSRSAALKSVTQRRDYGAHPTAACISKSTERALREEGRLQQPSRPAPGNELDAIDWEEEEDWANDVTDTGRAWEPLGLDRHLSRQDHSLGMTRPVQQSHQWHQQQQIQPHSHQQFEQRQQLPTTAQPAERQSLLRLRNAPSLHQTSGHTSTAQQHGEASNPLGPQPDRQQPPSTSSYQAHQVPNVLQQNKLTGQAEPVQRAQGAAETAAGGLDVMHDHQLLGSAGCLQQASPTLMHGNSLSFDSAAAGIAAGCSNNAQQRGDAGGAIDAMHMPGRGQSLCPVPLHPDPPDTGPNSGHAIATEVQKADAVVEDQTAVPESLQSVTSTEQSDYELALRLQAQERAMHRQHSRPVMNGRLGVKQKPRQTSGTLHAFFKQA